MTDEQRRIRSYLQAQGAKLSPVQVIEKIRAAMTELSAAALSVPAARFGERPAPTEWSANDVMAHVVDADAHFGGGIVSILDGRPAPGGVERRAAAQAPLRTAEAWGATLGRAREALFARVRAADPTAHLDRTIEHPMFGPLNWRETLLFQRLHDLDHAGQLRQIAAGLG